MSNFYAYDGSTWRDAAEVWSYDGATWRDIQEAWSYDGATWRKVFEVSGCATGTCNSMTGAWEFNTPACADCASGRCLLCLRGDWGTCDNSCHEIDAFVSVNGGSYNAAFTCSNLACDNDTGCDCGAGGSFEFSCMHNFKCVLDSATYQGRLKIIRLSDSGTECTVTEAGSHTGDCSIA